MLKSIANDKNMKLVKDITKKKLTSVGMIAEETGLDKSAVLRSVTDHFLF